MTTHQKRSNRFADWVVDHPWITLLSTLVIIFSLASGARFLSFTTDYRVFFGPDNPQLQAFEKIENTYTKNDNVYFAVTPKDGQVFTRETLASIEELTDQAWQIPYSIRVDSITNYQHSYAEEDDLIVGNLIEDAASLTEEELTARQAIAVNEPLLKTRLINADASVTAVNVTIQLPGIDPISEVPEVVSAARALAEKISASNPNLTFHLSGMVMFNNGFAEASQYDMQNLVPLALAAILIGLVILLRGWTGTFSTFWVIVFSVACGLGFAGWMGIKLTPPSMASITIILTLAVADSVHILVSFFEQMRKGASKRDAMAESLRINIQPVFLTSITTALGFLSMNFSDAPPFQDLGNIVAAGVIAAFVITITLLPSILMIIPVRQPAPVSRSSTAMDQFANFVIRRRNALLWGMGIIIIGLASFVPKNELNDVFVHYFDETLEIRQAIDYSAENLAGLYTIIYSLDSGESGGISDPEFVKQVDDFAVWFRQQPNVDHVSTITDTLRRLNKNMHGDDPSYYKLPDDRNLTAQYLLLYEMSLPYGLDLNDQINVDKSATKMTVTMQAISSNDFLGLVDQAEQWRAQNTPDLIADGSSPTVMFSHLGRRNIRSMLTGTVLALGLISIILIVALRSVKIGLISLIPNLAPAAMAFGIWGLFVGQVGLALSVVIGMTLGIVVDDTVHFLSKYLRARRELGLDSIEAVRVAFSSVGMALWFTSLVLIAGFLVLSQSAFQMNSQMGMMTAITIALALIADFLFLPPLLMKLEQNSDA